MRLKRATSIILVCAMFISGCSSNSDINEKDEDKTRYLDLEGEFTFSDTTHFISAPEIEYKESGITEFDASYTMIVTDTDASFVFGDAKGEYGTLVLCQIGSDSGSDMAHFTVKSCVNGCYTDSVTSDDGTVFCINRPDDDSYAVTLNIQDGKLSGSVNGTQLPNYVIPSFDLGTVGAYKSRGTMTA